MLGNSHSSSPYIRRLISEMSRRQLSDIDRSARSPYASASSTAVPVSVCQKLSGHSPPRRRRRGFLYGSLFTVGKLIVRTHPRYTPP